MHRDFKMRYFPCTSSTSSTSWQSLFQCTISNIVVLAETIASPAWEIFILIGPVPTTGSEIKISTAVNWHLPCLCLARLLPSSPRHVYAAAGYPWFVVSLHEWVAGLPLLVMMWGYLAWSICGTRGRHYFVAIARSVWYVCKPGCGYRCSVQWNESCRHTLLSRLLFIFADNRVRVNKNSSMLRTPSSVPCFRPESWNVSVHVEEVPPKNSWCYTTDIFLSVWQTQPQFIQFVDLIPRFGVKSSSSFPNIISKHSTPTGRHRNRGPAVFVQICLPERLFIVKAVSLFLRLRHFRDVVASSSWVFRLEFLPLFMKVSTI